MKTYLAHPYGGLENNKKEIERYTILLNKNYPKLELFSPVHIFEQEYHSTEYLEGIELCFNLLDSCDLVLFPKTIFMTSRGCNMEYGFSRAINKRILFYDMDGVIYVK